MHLLVCLGVKLRQQGGQGVGGLGRHYAVADRLEAVDSWAQTQVQPGVKPISHSANSADSCGRKVRPPSENGLPPGVISGSRGEGEVDQRTVCSFNGRELRSWVASDASPERQSRALGVAQASTTWTACDGNGVPPAPNCCCGPPFSASEALIVDQSVSIVSIATIESGTPAPFPLYLRSFRIACRARQVEGCSPSLAIEAAAVGQNPEDEEALPSMGRADIRRADHCRRKAVTQRL